MSIAHWIIAVVGSGGSGLFMFAIAGHAIIAVKDWANSERAILGVLLTGGLAIATATFTRLTLWSLP
jgi:uncharacterized membrane protein